MSDSFQVDHKQKKTSNLQGANQLIVEAIVSITNIVESMHSRIDPIANPIQSPDGERTKGITSLVYKSIRSLTTIVEKSIDTPLGLISDLLEKKSDTGESNVLLSALNGILGDHLVKRNSPLAIPMTLKRDGKLIDSSELAESVALTNGKLIIMVHGLCMNDQQWSKAGHDHGQALANDLGQTVVYLHYNTGQHISVNGEAFSVVLEELVTQILATNSELPLEISLIAHSMGGLVSRSAFFQAKLIGRKWPDSIKNMIFLGTPHHGAPLEKLGNWLDMLVGIHAYSSPLKPLLQVRSAGITDLRHGNVIESDWQTRNRFDFASDKRTPVELPKSVKCFAIATTTTSHSNSISEQIIGDGLVPLNSGLGKHENKQFTLKFPASHQWIGSNINHMQQLGSPEVYSVIRGWLGGRVDESPNTNLS